MSDLVERLRNAWTTGEIDPYFIPEAADELERLRSENAILREALKTHGEEAAKWVSAEPVAHIKRNAAGQIHMTDNAGNSFDMSKHIGVSLYTSPRLPDGWVMVPKEPTLGMIKAGNIGQGFSLQALKAAIAAAPKPETKQDMNICSVCGIDKRLEACMGNQFICPQA